jgi:hypothetical protein
VLDLDFGYAALYLDGLLVGERNDVPFTPASIFNTHSYIGRSAFTWDPLLRGAVSEIRIHQGHMNAAQVAAAYAAGPAVIPAKLQAAVNGDGRDLLLSWEAAAGDLNLYRATNLVPPAIWRPITNTAVVSNQLRTIVVPIETGASFFRLGS